MRVLRGRSDMRFTFCLRVVGPRVHTLYTMLSFAGLAAAPASELFNGFSIEAAAAAATAAVEACQTD